MPEKPAPIPEIKRLPVLLRRAWYGLNQAFRQRVAPLGLTPDQFSILRWLSEGDPRGLTQRTLTDLMASDPNTITSTLSRMESAGLIARHPQIGTVLTRLTKAGGLKVSANGIRMTGFATFFAIAVCT